MSTHGDLLKSLKIERDEATSPEVSSAPHPWGLAGVVSGALLLGVAIGWIAKPDPQAVAAAPVEAVDRVLTPPANRLNASGYVVARRSATVAAEVTGRVIAVPVEEGQFVLAGQVLAILEPRLARAERDAALARQRAAAAERHEAKLVADRTQALAREGIASDARLSAAQARLETTEARERAAQSDAARANAQLARYRIRAPFAGVITRKSAQPGEIISPVSAGGGFTRTGICTIVDMQSLEIEVDVNEAFIASVQEGARAEAVLDAYPDVTFRAHVIAIIPAANRERATFRVRVAFEELDPRILPDMAIQVTFLGDRNQGASTSG